MKLRLLALSMALAGTSLAATPSAPAWLQQFGAFEGDYLTRLAQDTSGNIYAAGNTAGSFDGLKNIGTQDGFLSKRDAAGKVLWQMLLGGKSIDGLDTMLVGSKAIVVGGVTSSDIGGIKLKGKNDAYVAAVSPEGQKLWEFTFGTADNERVSGITQDSAGNYYLVGSTYGMFEGTKGKADLSGFIAKVSPAGKLQWVKQTTRDVNYMFRDVVIYQDNLYIVGKTSNKAGGIRGFLTSFDLQGKQRWEVAVGREDSKLNQDLSSIAITPDNQLVIGGQLDIVNSIDAYVAKYDLKGKPVWQQSLGSSDIDGVYSVAVDAQGTISAVGMTMDMLPQQHSAGAPDGFLVRYNAKGEQIFLRQFGSIKPDIAVQVTPNGNYIGGMVYNVELPNQKRGGDYDVYIAHITDAKSWEQFDNIEGEKPKWTFSGIDYRLMNTLDTTGAFNSINSVATNEDKLFYVAGSTDGQTPKQMSPRLPSKRDAYLAKYNTRGDLLWTSQWGTLSIDGTASAQAVTEVNSEVYVVGTVNGSFSDTEIIGDDDVFLTAMDTDGNRVWTRQLGGTARDTGVAVATDTAGNIYVLGNTSSNLTKDSLGQQDMFLAKYSAEGKQIWLKQLGSSGTDVAKAMVMYKDVLYIVGASNGAVGSNKALGDYDAVVMAVNAAGKVLWSNQLGDKTTNAFAGVAVTAKGTLVAVGNTKGGSGYQGGYDISVSTLDTNGKVLSNRLYGSKGDDQAAGVVTQGENIFVYGKTTGTWGNSKGFGAYDALVLNIDSSNGGNSERLLRFGLSEDDSVTGIGFDTNMRPTLFGTSVQKGRDLLFVTQSK